MSATEDNGPRPVDQPLTSESLLEAVVSNAPIVLFATDADGVITMSRGKGLQALGVREGQLVGQSIFDLYPAESAVADAGLRALAGEPVAARLDLDGTIHEMLCAPFFQDGEVRGLVGVSTDVTEREQAEALLRHQATHNPTTGLPNRGHFIEALDSLVAAENESDPRPVTVLVLLFERFQEMSETFGYEVGSQVLRECASRLREAAQAEAVIGALEAGKFGLAVPLPLRSMAPIIRSLLDHLGEPYTVEGQEVSLAVSAGVATFPGHGQQAEMLLRAAEQAARMATSAHQPYAVYEPQAADLRRNFTLLADLRAALGTDSLRVEYQPLVDMRRSAIDSLEALARWDHPQYGPVSPVEFIAIADRGGLLPRITEFVMESAMRDLYRWAQQDLHPRVAVNISPGEILSPSIEETLRPTLDTWGMGIERLTLEVTEHNSLGQISSLQETLLSGMTDAGMHLAIDDFGTGYSNISSLHRLPWTELKIDRSFVQEITSVPAARQLVGAMIDLGHSFGRTVTAEGVETAEQWDHLLALGCDTVQGYHMTRPLRPEALSAFVEQSPWHQPGA